MHIDRNIQKFVFIFSMLVLAGSSASSAAAETLDYLKDVVKKTETERGVKVSIQTDSKSDPIVVVGSQLPMAQHLTETTGYAMTNAKSFVYSQSENVLWIAEVKAPYMDLLGDQNYHATGVEVSIGHSGRSDKIRQALFNTDKATAAPDDDNAHTLVDLVTKEATTSKVSTVEPYLNIAVSRHKFKDDKDRSRQVASLTPGVIYTLNVQTKMSAEAFVRMEDAQDAKYDHSSIGARVEFLRQVNDNLATQVGYQFSQNSFSTNSADPMMPARNDTESVFALVSSWKMNDPFFKDLALNMQYQYVRYDSTLAGYNYDRQIGLLSLSKKW